MVFLIWITYLNCLCLYLLKAIYLPYGFSPKFRPAEFFNPLSLCPLFSAQRFLNWDHSWAEIRHLLWEVSCSWLLPATDTSLHQTREPDSSNNKQLVRGITSQQQCTCCSNCRRDSPLTSRPERIAKCRLGIAIAKGKVLTALLRNNLWPKPRLWSRLKMLWNHTPDTYAVLTSLICLISFSLSLCYYLIQWQKDIAQLFFSKCWIKYWLC